MLWPSAKHVKLNRPKIQKITQMSQRKCHITIILDLENKIKKDSQRAGQTTLAYKLIN